MELKGSRGYLLPETIDPSEYICFSMYVPAADEYIVALSGALHELATWKVWEKDGTTRAAQAAAVWKDAIDLSIEQLWWDGVVMTCKNVEDLISAIANIQINVSGGGCCDPFKEFRVPTDWEENHPDELPPLVTDPTTVPTGDLCDNAHSTWAGIYEIIDKFAEFTLEESAGYDELYAYLQSKAAFLVPVAAVMFAAMNFVYGGLYSVIEEGSLSFWNSFKNKFICAILSHDNAEDLYAWLVAELNAADITIAVREWLKTIIQMVDWNLLYDELYDIEPEFVGSDCSFCQVIGMPAELPEGWSWFAAPETAVSYTPNQETGSVVYDRGFGATFELTPLTGNNFHEVIVNIDVSAVQTAWEAERPEAFLGLEGSAGLVYDYVLPQFSNDGVRYSSNTGGSLDMEAVDLSADWFYYHRNDMDTTLADYMALQTSTYSYGNGFMGDTKASFRMQTYGVPGKALKHRIYYLVKHST